MTILCLVVLYAPLIIVMIYSFNDSKSITAGAASACAGTRTSSSAWRRPSFKAAAWNSLSIAVMASIASTIIATARRRSAWSAAAVFRGKSLTFGLISLPIMVPEIVTAVATLIFFSTIGFTRGYFSIVVAHIVFCIPFAYLPISARLQGIESTYEQAALDLYASRAQAFGRVLMPLMMPGIISGFLLAFIISLDDFIITNFVKGAGIETLPTAIFGSVKQGIKPNIMALSTLMLMVSILFVTISYFVGKSGAKTAK